jgi:hypothetical protein
MVEIRLIREGNQDTVEDILGATSHCPARESVRSLSREVVAVSKLMVTYTRRSQSVNGQLRPKSSSIRLQAERVQGPQRVEEVPLVCLFIHLPVSRYSTNRGIKRSRTSRWLTETVKSQAFSFACTLLVVYVHWRDYFIFELSGILAYCVRRCATPSCHAINS